MADGNLKGPSVDKVIGWLEKGRIDLLQKDLGKLPEDALLDWSRTLPPDLLAAIIAALPAESPVRDILDTPPPPPAEPDPRDHPDFAGTGPDVVVEDYGDVAIYRGTPGDDEIRPPKRYIDATVFGGAGDDIITIRTYGNVYSGSGNDVVTSAGGQMWGGSGNDVLTSTATTIPGELIGGYGADILNGGETSDRFYYFSAKDTGDTINGFERGEDVVYLAEFGSFEGESDPPSFVFQGEVASEDDLQAFGIGYVVQPGGVRLLVDTDGVAGADLMVFMTGIDSLAATDFLL